MCAAARTVGAMGAGPAVFFLSDYGTADEFVGVVHAVLHRLAPSAPVIDLSHQIPAFDVAGAAALLVRAGPHLGPGVVLAVVDPGVGTDRRGVAVELPPGGPTWLVGPDNGLLLPLAEARGGVRSAVVLEPAHLGAATAGTFDGRDVFAPAAAHLVRGGNATVIGTLVDPATLTTGPDAPRDGSRPDPAGSGLVTTVTWIDHFGNVQVDLAPDALSGIGLAPGGTASLRVDPGPMGELHARWVRGYGELGPGEWGILSDANGRVALVLDRASAARALGLAGPGVEVRIAAHRREDPA